MEENLTARRAGLLLHISSLPNQYPIGDLGLSAYRFVDFLHAAGQSWWQILPLCPTRPEFGNSPYMSLSGSAGNPLFISPEALYEAGLLDAPPAPFPHSSHQVDFEAVTCWKETLLRQAFQNFKTQKQPDSFKEFKASHGWLADHSLFMALKKNFDQAGWFSWPAAYRQRDKATLAAAADTFADEIEFHWFCQYQFFSQWKKLHAYAQVKGISIIGDLPIYVALDSVDVWANQKIFRLDEKTGLPTHVAGVPPDYFSATGQLWGNPLYRWRSKRKKVKEQLYNWWEQRLQRIYDLVDMVRLDHFRGFESFWSVPANEETAENGSWKKGPGVYFFREMEQRLGVLPMIAEDLGIITPEVEALRDELGYPGMKILLFAFDGQPGNNYLPHQHARNCVVYTGTHDNDTVVGWYHSENVPEAAKQQVRRYSNASAPCTVPAHSIHNDFIQLALSSPAFLAIMPMQDVLGFGNDCRMNLPGTGSDNWTWRCAEEFFTPELTSWIADEVQFFDRFAPEQTETQAAELTQEES